MATWADEFRLVMLCAVIPIVMIVIFTIRQFFIGGTTRTVQPLKSIRKKQLLFGY